MAIQAVILVSQQYSQRSCGSSNSLCGSVAGGTPVLCHDVYLPPFITQMLNGKMRNGLSVLLRKPACTVGKRAPLLLYAKGILKWANEEACASFDDDRREHSSHR